jgi:predicted nucleic acid-binding protein
VTAFVDSNVLIRHLTGDPPDMARRATALIREVDEMLLADLILAEIIYVLESFYEVQRHEVARLARAVLAFPSMRTIDPALLLRAIEVYETAHLDFAEAYLVASAETAGVIDIASFDRSIDRIPSVNRIEP